MCANVATCYLFVRYVDDQGDITSIDLLEARQLRSVLWCTHPLPINAPRDAYVIPDDQLLELDQVCQTVLQMTQIPESLWSEHATEWRHLLAPMHPSWFTRETQRFVLMKLIRWLFFVHTWSLQGYTIRTIDGFEDPYYWMSRDDDVKMAKLRNITIENIIQSLKRDTNSIVSLMSRGELYVTSSVGSFTRLYVHVLLLRVAAEEQAKLSHEQTVFSENLRWPRLLVALTQNYVQTHRDLSTGQLARVLFDQLDAPFQRFLQLIVEANTTKK